MMITDILAASRVQQHADVRSRKRALEIMSQALAEGTPYLPTADILTGLVEREKLGNTGVGQGLALPHARLNWLDDCLGAFIQLHPGLDFGAGDGQPVDLMLGLLFPEPVRKEHVRLLHQLNQALSTPTVMSRLRAASDPTQLYHRLLDIPLAETQPNPEH